MEAISIILPKKLGVKLKEKAEATGYLPEELGVELLRKSLNEELDPEEVVEQYQMLGDKYLAEAKELLKEGNLVQVSEKLWGASALAVKMVAARRGLKLERHRSLWEFVSELSSEKGDKDIIRFFHISNSLHRNFYENQMNQEAIEIALEDIEKLIAKLREVK